MAKEELVLAIDIGATSIKLCEFAYGSKGEIFLNRFAHREYEEELSEGTRMGVVAGLLRQMLAEGGFTARRAMVCMSGQSSLMRFTRLPTGNYDKKQIRQMAEFDATQNIPFAANEVIMDYQLIASSTENTADIMSVVIKNDIVEQFTAAISQVGGIPILIDVAPAACYNAARACGLGNEECDIILNIGGRVTNLVFCEGDRFYARTIPIAGYSITQQIAKEFGISLPEAEELKRQHGFVALGGAYAEPDSETAANVSKIVRNVMARLHGEITRTINVYRAQQKGSKPSKLYITGGSSIFTYTDTFFNEKLGIPVEYFNPFQCVQLQPSVDRQRLMEVGHMFSECIGIGLRYADQCPVELSLIPATIRRQQDFDRKKPWLALAGVSIMALLGLVWFGVVTRTDSYDRNYHYIDEHFVRKAKPYVDAIESANAKTNAARDQAKTVTSFLHQSAVWPSILNEIYRIKPDGLWLTSFKIIENEVKPFETQKMAEVKDIPMGADEDGMFAFSADDRMFGGGFGGGASEATASGSMVKIAGLELEGCAVQPTESAIPVHLGPVIAFPFEVQMPPQKEGAPQLSPNELMLQKIREANATTPEQAFLTALRASPLFSSEEKLTAITFYKASEKFSNYAVFRMQVKFDFNLEYFKVGASTAKK
ncbi:MAG: pilus assembly protein PilM [Victivallales bacterium]|nr:pilus assembly protein PilM [Victivallales bacterium]